MKRLVNRENAFLVFEEGEELMSGLTEFANEYGDFLITGGIGSIENINLGFYDGTKYQREEIVEPQELLNASGNGISEPFVHCHVTISDNEYKARGGHLFSAKIAVIAEINITLLRHRHPIFNLFKKGLKREEVPGKELRLLTNCGFV